MEVISYQTKGVKIKGKNGSILVSPEKTTQDDCFISLDESVSSNMSTAGLCIASPGDYEYGGIKIKGSRVESKLYYSIVVDGVEVLIAKLSSLNKIHGKLQDHMIVLADADEESDPSAISSLASNILVLFGDKSLSTAEKYMKESFKKSGKISAVKDKLPQEVETIVIS